MSDPRYDLLVLGAGPGGYTAAVRAARAGKKVGLIEREQLGGVCLNWGCIPTKALLHSAGLWRAIKSAHRHGIAIEGARFDYAAVHRRSRQVVTRLVKGLELLMKQAGVEVIAGEGRLAPARDGRPRVRVRGTGAGGGAQERVLAAEDVILAAGSVMKEVPGLPLDLRRVIGSREAVDLTELPESILVIGAGAIGLEFADLFATFGVKVTVIEMMPQILPTEDPDVAQVLRNALAKRGIKIHTATKLAGGEVGEVGVRGELVGEDEARRPVAAERALVAVGVTGAIHDLGLEEAGVETGGGFVRVDERQATSASRVYAIGDLTGSPMLAHAASAAGIRAVERILGRPAPEGLDWVPAAVFTHPQVASVGARERDLKAQGTAYRSGTFPFSALGKAVAEGEPNGFVKVLLEEDEDCLLGAHVVGPGASELIAELTLAGAQRLSGRALLETVHTHPTLAEALPEAVGQALGVGIHG